MSLHIRAVQKQDAPAMARILNDIIAIGGTTAYRQPFDEQGISDVFIAPKLAISCFVAIDGTQLLGFQSLEWCNPNSPGDDALPADWALIATYVKSDASGQGVGRKLFTQTAKAAKDAGVHFIDATIRMENTGGQAFYQGVGFTVYRTGKETVSKRFAPV